MVGMMGRTLAGLCVALACTQVSAAARDLTVTTADGERRAILVEADAPGPVPRPLVLVLHGHMGSAGAALGLKRLSPSPLSQWATIAERENIIVAALDGSKGRDGEQGWNDCRADADNNPASDDVAFARAVVRKLVGEGRADPERVYAMGMSNGGMMAFRLGLQMPELAAFAAVSASMAATSQCPQKPSPRVAALIINGDADPLVPYAGGQVKFGSGPPRGGVIPVPAAFALWAEAHRHDVATATVRLLPARKKGDDTQGRASFFGPELADADVAMVRIEGGGHVEPSLAHRYRAVYLHFVGAQSSVFESAEVAWAFFRGKSREVARPDHASLRLSATP